MKSQKNKAKEGRKKRKKGTWREKEGRKKNGMREKGKKEEKKSGKYEIIRKIEEKENESTEVILRRVALTVAARTGIIFSVGGLQKPSLLVYPHSPWHMLQLLICKKSRSQVFSQLMP